MLITITNTNYLEISEKIPEVRMSDMALLRQQKKKEKEDKRVIIDVNLSALLNKTTHKSNLALPE